MVKSQLPMWERDIGISRPSTARTEPAAQAGSHETPTQGKAGSARAQPAEKVKGITPRKKKTRKQAKPTTPA